MTDKQDSGKLWVFGDSLSTGYNLNSTQISWPEILASKLSLMLCNFAQPAVDNFYIYQSVMQFLPDIKSTDLVVIGWSHPNRKVFALDMLNPLHTSIVDQSLVYQSHGRDFFRYNGTTRTKEKHLLPQTSGVDFFDHWFQNYFNSFEQRIMFQAMLDSIKSRLPTHIQFFFSEESITGIDTQSSDQLCAVDFIIRNEQYISKNDLHFNANGHRTWANLLMQKLT